MSPPLEAAIVTGCTFVFGGALGLAMSVVAGGFGAGAAHLLDAWRGR